MKLRSGIFKRRFVSADSGGKLGGGYSVQLRLHKLTYREGNHTLKAGVEPLKGGAWMIYLDTIGGWDPPFADDSLMPEDIAKIRSNIVRALDAMGVKYHASGLPGTILE
jgi:hypothetical protein